MTSLGILQIKVRYGYQGPNVCVRLNTRICDKKKDENLRRCVANLSIEQLGAIEGKREEERGKRLSHLAIWGKIRTQRKEGEKEERRGVSWVSSGNLSPIGSQD